MLLTSVSGLTLLVSQGAALASPAPFSSGWYALKAASGPAASAAIANAANGAGISGKTYAQVRQSLANLQHSAAALAAMQSLQSQAHAIVAAGTLANGLQIGGIVPDSGLAAPGVANAVTSWTGANAPVQIGPAGRPTVIVRQTAPGALLNWRTLNVGRNTTLAFDQSAGGAAAPTWVALNRVHDPNVSPTQILGNVTAQGHVIVINGSGIIFAPTAQVTVGSLIASTADIGNAQFASATGIYSPDSKTPTFTGAKAPILVEPGAAITTNQPISATNAGGGVILLGSSVTNAGDIQTSDGQTILAAGRDFILQQGYGVSASGQSYGPVTTALEGNLPNQAGFGPGGTIVETVEGSAVAVADGGAVRNSGLIEARTGDVTLVGETVTQAGVITSTTSVSTRGTIHLLTDQTDPNSSVTLAPNSVTTILPDPNSNTALDAQRATDVTGSENADLVRTQSGALPLNDQPALPDNQYQSLIQIVSGNDVDVRGNALAMSQGGQIQVSAPGRVLVEAGAQLDVSGTVGVSLPMSANDVAVNVQGFELRDNPLNRDTTLLNNANVYLDARTLVSAPGSDAYANSPYTAGTQPRLYSPSGLFEVSGEISNIPHTIDEWTSAGGTILISSGSTGQVVAQPGSTFNLAGGSIDYQAGALKLTWLIGPNGQLYNAATAPNTLVYTGVYGGFAVSHPRWNISQTYNNPLVAPSSVEEPGYTVGRDGGMLEISAPTAILEGSIDAGVVDGPLQNQPRVATIDPYLQPQNAVPLPGSLVIGQTSGLAYGPTGIAGGFNSIVTLVVKGAPIASSLALMTSLPPTRLDTVILDTDTVNSAGLGGLSIATTGSVDVSSPLTVATAGVVQLEAPTIVVGANISAHAGSVRLGNELTSSINEAAGITQTTALISSAMTSSMVGTSVVAAPIASSVVVGPDVTIDTSGLFTNPVANPVDVAGEAAAAGGSIDVDTTGSITLARGSLIDASSGAVVSRSGTLGPATGGSVTLIGDDANGNPAGANSNQTSALPVAIAGAIRSIGVSGGGSFTLRSPGVLIAADRTKTTDGLSTDGRTVLTSSDFQSGFTSYVIDGYGNIPPPAMTSMTPIPGVEVATGIAVHPVVPIYLAMAATLTSSTGTAPGAALSTYLPPLYSQNQTTATLTARVGASLSLQSRSFSPNAGSMTAPLDGGGSVLVDHGASITVDPSQSVAIEALGQITVDGTITAPSGAISLQNDIYEPGTTSIALEYNPDLSIWIGADARLDVAGVAETASDRFGRLYGIAPDGGSITIGGPQVVASDSGGSFAESTDAFVITRPGAVVDASGSEAVINQAAGPAPGAPSDPITVAGAGGKIELNSTSGIVIDGTLRAAAGSPTAAGGALTIDLVTPTYGLIVSTGGGIPSLTPYPIPLALEIEREILLTQTPSPSPLPSSVLPGVSDLSSIYGVASLSQKQISDGGFGSLTLASDAFGGFGPADLRFIGNVSLSIPESIDLPGVLTESSTNAHVSITAPYIRFDSNEAVIAFTVAVPGTAAQGGALLAQTSALQSNQLANTPSTAATASALSVNADQLAIDHGDLAGIDVVNSGLPVTSNASPTSITFDQPGFGDVSLFSAGDTQVGGAFRTLGNLSITAAQVYPTSPNALLEIGVDDGQVPASPLAQPHTLTLARTTGTSPPPPMSVENAITLIAGTIEQGGILRAPLGQITLGDLSALPGTTNQIDLLPGSVTSVSLAGQTVLYGGTADGVGYDVNGQSGSPNIAPRITLGAQSVALDAGATIDLRGGGTLAGAAFNSGRGGSTDVLTAAFLRMSGNTAAPTPGDEVYAILPGYEGVTPPSPITAVAYSSAVEAPPPTGEQITIGTGVLGLPAGTDTLLPAYDALLPGAFRVELQPAMHPSSTTAASVANLSSSISATTGIAGTAVRGTQAINVLVTSGAAVRRLSSYDEENYSTFETAQAAKLDEPRGFVPADAGTLVLDYALTSPFQNLSRGALSVAATPLFAPGPGGYGGIVEVAANAMGQGLSEIDIVGDNAEPADTIVAGTTAVSLRASDLNRLAPETLAIGGAPALTPGGEVVELEGSTNGSGPVVLGPGATLSAPQVFLLSDTSIEVQQGASIDTLADANPVFGAAEGERYANEVASPAAVIVSDALLNVAAPASGATGTITIDDGATLVGQGTVALDTAGTVSIGNQAILAARELSLAIASANVVSSSGVPDGVVVPTGLTLSQALLNSLFAGGIVPGAPGLQIIDLTASNSLNLFGAANFALGPANGSQTLLIDTPSIYGFGASGDVATITAGTVVWNGLPAAGSNISLPPAPVYLDGPGAGQGTLSIDAGQIVLGYPSGQVVPTGATILDRTIYGFSNVDLHANGQVIANNNGTLSVYRSQGAYTNGGYANGGGNLTISSPVLTTTAGATLQVTAGGEITLANPGDAGGAPGGLGGEIDLTGASISVATNVALPEGKLSLSAAGDIDLNAGADVRLAGVRTTFFDQTVPGPGGTLVAESTNGNIIVDPASTIDVSSPGASAGLIQLTATGGTISLAGPISGSGNTGGAIEIRAGILDDFSGLNQRLTEGGVFGARSFEIGAGELSITSTDRVKASNVSISLDSGSLTIDGLIDASGAAPGTISLSAGGNLTLTANALLDAHGNVAQTDSTGGTIDAENTGSVTLRVADGPNGTNLTANGTNKTLTIEPGAAINVSAPTGVACALGPCGQVEIDVPRLGAADGTNGDLAISVPGPVAITGAGSVAVNGFWSYAPADGIVYQVNAGAGGDTTGIGLDQINAANQAFIASAIPNGKLNPALTGKLAGLTAYGKSFHLRPGVEIDSSAMSGGNLTVDGDLDLSALRYTSVNKFTQLSSAYGSGEPGVLVLRASHDLNIYGSITDGFAQPVDSSGAQNPDDNGWILQGFSATNQPTDQNIYLPPGALTPGALPVDVGGSTYPNSGVLNYDLPLAGGQSLNPGTVLPTSVTLASPLVVPAGGVVAAGNVIAADGVTVLYEKGQVIPTGTTLPGGASLAAGFVLFTTTTLAAINALTTQNQSWPAGANLAAFNNSVQLAASVPLATGDLIPANTTLQFASGDSQINLRQPITLPNGLTGQGEIYGASDLLPPGSLSWSIALVAGANQAAADPSVLTSSSALAAARKTGDLTLADLHYSEIVDPTFDFTDLNNLPIPNYLPAFSVVRTGTGSLGLFAGGSIDVASSYGIYTAGTQSPNVAASYNQRGAALPIDPTIQSAAENAVYNAVDASYPQAGGNVAIAAQQDIRTISLAYEGTTTFSTETGDWLIRQGGATAADPGAWSINFGDYEPVLGSTSSTNTVPLLVGFAGIGTLGGGNLTVRAGRNAGVMGALPATQESAFLQDTASDDVLFQYDDGLNLVVASTGRVMSSGMVKTGGGRLLLSVGNILDPSNAGNPLGFSGLQSALVDLRGSIGIDAGSVGQVDATVGLGSAINNPYLAGIRPGPNLLLGDATASLVTRGDLSLGEAYDPGLEPTILTPNGTTSWFTLWNASTAIDLYSAGGSISPLTIPSQQNGTVYYPPTLNAVAASGSIYTLDSNGGGVLELAPAATGQLRFLAHDSIIDGEPGNIGIIFGPTVDISGADPSQLPTANDPAYSINVPGQAVVSNSLNAAPIDSLFAFSVDSATGFLHAGDPEPARFYAATGNIEDLSTGQIISGSQYLAAKSVRIEAGNNIVEINHAPNSGLFFNVSPNDISVISAGNNIFYANARVAGPGLLQVSAGGSIDQTDTTPLVGLIPGDGPSDLTSLGYLVDKTVATQGAGAGITVTSGVTQGNIDLSGFANLYLSGANLANPVTPLQNQPGKVERTYQDQLIAFLQQRIGYNGSVDGALAAFLALPPEVQQILALQVYFQELNQSGLDYNDPSSRFFRSYSEGTEAVRALFPMTDISGQSPAIGGSLTLTGGSGINTDFGGAIQIADPFGATTIGVPGAPPPSTAGVITGGTGDVDLYSYGSVLLGQSRIFTTFGGNLLVWLEGNGEINGGQGSKSTIVFTPPNITYDPFTDIALAPTVPSTGAGLAVLAPVAGVPPGNINLISPFGTIDAGEAGIRASGNINLVALTIINAANVQAGGKVTGVPIAAVSNVAATNAASAVAGAAQNAAQNNIRLITPQKTPSIITVDIVGCGSTESARLNDDCKQTGR